MSAIGPSGGLPFGWIGGGSGSGSGSEYLSYVALLSQSGVNNPVATVLENELSGVPVWTRSSDGEFFLTLAGAFPANRVVFFVKQGNLISTAGFILWGYRVDNNNIFLAQWDAGGSYVDVMDQVSFELRVYPA